MQDEVIIDIENSQESDDLISRQAVLDLVNSDWKYEGLETDIASLPSVTQKSGKWIKTDEGFSPYECSICGSIEFKGSNYCPNCGAKMESEDKR